MKLGEAIYKAESENPENKEEETGAEPDGDVFDADFEDLTDEKK